MIPKYQLKTLYLANNVYLRYNTMTHKDLNREEVKMIKLLKYISWVDWIVIFVTAGFIVLGVWMDLQIPLYLREITSLITGETPNGTTQDILIQGGFMLSFAAGSMVVAVIVAIAGAVVSSRHSERVRKDVYEKVGDFSVTEIKKFSVASLITRSTNDITQVRLFVALAIQMLIRVPVLAIWSLIKINDASFELSLVTLGGLALLIIVPTIITLVCLPGFKKVQKHTDGINQVTRENLTGMRVVRAFDAKEFEDKKFEGTNQNLYRQSLFVNRTLAIAFPFLGLVLNMVNLGIYWVGSYLINYGGVANQFQFFADLMVFSQYSLQVLFAFMMLIWIITLLPRTLVSAKRINEVLATDSTILDPVDVEKTLVDGDIIFNNVSFQYPDASDDVLTDINITIKKGSTVAFIGATGGGKSSLVNLIPRILDTTAGSITIGGIAVNEVSLENLHDHVGYVPQTATLFKGSIKENIAFGTVAGKTIDEESVIEALKVAQAYDFVSKLENGIDSEVVQAGKNFSGGQKQRLSIARVLARKPKVLIFDDTFSALDYKTDLNLRTEIANKFRETTVLIVAQRIGTIKTADQIFVLDEGRIVAAGTHEELFENSKIYQEIALSQLNEEELV